MNIVNLSQSLCGNFLAFFCLQFTKTHRFHWFKIFLLQLFSLSFFHKMMKLYKVIFPLHEEAVLLPNFSSHKNTTEIYLIYGNVLLWILSDCLDFDRNPLNFIYNSFLKKLYTFNLSILYCYQLLILLFGRISPGAIISYHLKPNLWILRKIWLSECFIIWESFFFLIINQEVGYPAIYMYTLYFPKILLS